MTGKRPSNPLALAVLSLLAEEPMHPYQMSSTLRERRKEASIKINFGSLYSVVESLQKRGLIAVAETIRDGNRPERTVYQITEAGQTMMVDWLTELLSTPAKEFPQFEAALSLMAGLPPDDVIQLLEHRLTLLRGECQAGQRMVDQAASVGMPRLFTIEHEYELAMQKAEAEFVEDLLNHLRSGTLSGLAAWRRMDELRAAGMPMDKIDATLRTEFKEDFSWLDRVDELT